jgi:hypothetical protein
MIARVCLFSVVAVFLMLGTASAQQDWDVYKWLPDGTPVPDVNKVPGPQIDNSCWQACAANILGAAGYGIGDDAQARADNIYGQLTVDLGTQFSGYAYQATNYWLYQYGKNPDSADFQPDLVYTDVTYVNHLGSLLSVNEYDFLLKELERCQYVAVGIKDVTEYREPWDRMPGHCMTLVGGNYGLTARPQQSVWHDSDDGIVGDAPHANAFPMGSWLLPNYLPGTVMGADSYTTLCPGLNKPEAAVREFDVAWFLQDLDATGAIDGVWDPGFRVAGEYAGRYTNDQGTTNPYWVDDYTVVIPNMDRPDLHKVISLLVDYIDRKQSTGGPDDPGIRVETPDGLVFAPDKIEWSEDGGQVLLTWILDEQPEWEKILFPSIHYKHLYGSPEWTCGCVKDWDLATHCVPEPGVWMLLAGGLAMLVVYRRRRRA